jgi:hypothetical protein
MQSTMRSVPVTAYVSELQKKRLSKRAEERCLPISGYLSRLIDRDDENSAGKKDDLLRPIEELEESLEETKDLSKCKSYSGLDALLNDLRSKYGSV